ncbi:hypothetical protein [Nocardioides sp.]|uniref:hypothetical protein n=1 Tax=Nocardioides sp. TaxID=35761 RepID=UPI002B271482|nr:hypothetical protein [Nocardioides sp.]
MTSAEREDPTAAPEPPESPELPGSVGWTYWILPGVLVLLILALAATSVVLLRDRREALPAETVVQPADIGSGVIGDAPNQQAVARARLAARSYFTLDHTTVEADMDRFRALGTPAFVEEYNQLMRSLSRQVVARQLRLEAFLPEKGVATEYLSVNAAQLLVSVDVTTSRGLQSRTAPYRTRVLLQRVDDQWLVAGVEEVR